MGFVDAAPDGVDGRHVGLLERDAELASLEAMVAGAAAGNGGLVVVEGSGGIGKTSLLAEARKFAATAGSRVLSARCGELEQEFAFGVVRQLFEPVLAAAPPGELEELFAGAANLAAPLFDLSGVTAAPPADDIAFAMLHGLYWLAANAALSRPTVLVVDDLQWCDGPSLRWLVHVARRLEGLPLMLALGTRPPEQAGHALLLTELIADPAAIMVHPTMLGVASVATIARDIFGAEPDEPFARTCHRVTGGNPLYLRALLTTLAADGLAPTAANTARLEAIGSEPVARVVALRLARLPREAEDLARAVAVLDGGADRGLAAELAGVDGEAADLALTRLTHVEILRLEPRLEFTHPIIRTSVYERLNKAERMRAHSRAAELLIARGSEPEHAAAHLMLVAPGEGGEIVPVLRDAARRALVRGGADTAVEYLRRALQESPTPERRAELLSELGLAERGVDLAGSVDHLREAIDLSADVESQAELALECGRALYFGLRNDEARDVFTQAVARLGARRTDLRELLEAETMHVSWFEPQLYPAVRDLLTRADPEGFVGGAGSDVLLAALSYYEARGGRDRHRCLALADRALRSRSLERGSSFGLYYALIATAVAGELDAAAAVWNSALVAARRRGDILTTLSTLTWRGFCALRRGELQNAESDVREGLELGDRTGFPPAVPYTAAFLVDALTERGELAEAVAVLDDRGLGEPVPESVHYTFFLAARGKLRLAERRPEQALEDFRAAGQTANALDVHNPAYSPWRSDSALALLALGDPTQARSLAIEELELSRRWAERRAVGISLRVLGLTEQGAHKERRLREAVEVLARSPARLEHAKALIDLGAALRRANRRSEAREILRQGVELAHRAAAPPLAERGNEELAATGARPRKLLQTGPDALTASERRVARLAAEEMSNKEIAQALFVTVKTVEVHLSNVYRKLDVASRRQLAVVLGADLATVSVAD